MTSYREFIFSVDKIEQGRRHLCASATGTTAKLLPDVPVSSAEEEDRACFPIKISLRGIHAEAA